MNSSGPPEFSSSSVKSLCSGAAEERDGEGVAGGAGFGG